MTALGIFWFVPIDETRSGLIHDMTPLEHAPAYGDMLTHDCGHAEFWEFLTRLGPNYLQSINVPTIPAYSEYDDWPRGRVVYDTRSDRFIIYADRQLHNRPFINQILRAFDLPPEKTTIQTDMHYARTRKIPPLLDSR